MMRSLSDRLGLAGNSGRSASERAASSSSMLSWRGGVNSYDEFDTEYEENLHGFDSEDEYSIYTVETVQSDRRSPKAVDRKQSQKQSQSQSESAPQATPEPPSTKISVGAESPLKDLKKALNDVSKVSVHLKDVKITREVASKLMELVRGDSRTWEAIAVDLIRQNLRWESIVFDSCSSSLSKKKIDKAALDNSMFFNNSLTLDDIVEDVDDDKAGEDKNDEDKNNEDKNVKDKDDKDKNDDSKDDSDTVNHLELVLSSILHLDNCSHIHLTGIKWSPTTSFAIQSIMFSRYLTKLQLDFIDLSNHVPALVVGLSGNKSLTCFIASRCGLDDGHLGTLLKRVPRGLEELRIFGNKCRSKGLESLTKIISSRRRVLQVLDISFQHIGPEEKFDIQSFAEALGGNETLRVLDLTNNSLTDDHLVQIISALCRNTTLEELMMNHNKITGAGVAMMAAKFGEMKGLKKISMYSNLFEGAS